MPSPVGGGLQRGDRKRRPSRGVLPVLLVLLAAFAAPRSAAAQDAIALTVASASAREQADGKTGRKAAMLDVKLGAFSRSLFGNWSRTHVGQRIEVRLDGKAVGQPMKLLTPLTGGILVVEAASLEAAQRFVLRADREGLVLVVVTVP